MKTIDKINMITGEYKPGDVAVQVAKCGHGKTSYMIFEAASAVLNNNNVLICSMEVDSIKLQERFIKSVNCLSEKGDIEGKYVIRHFKQGEYSIVNRLKTFINSLKNESKKPDIVFFDAFDMATFDMDAFKKGNESRREVYKNLVIELKALAKQMNMAIVINSQLSNVGGKINNKDIYEELVDFVTVLKKEDEKFTISPVFCRGGWIDFSFVGSFDFENVCLTIENAKFSFDGELIPIIKLMQGMTYVISPVGHGRTVFLLTLSEYFSELGKRTAFIGEVSEAKEKMIADKTKGNLGSAFIHEFDFSCDFIEGIKNLVSSYDINCLIIDDIDLYTTNSIDNIVSINKKLRELSIEENCAVIVGSQTRRVKENRDLEAIDVSKSVSKVAVADTVIAIKKHRPSFFKRLMEKIMFWKPKTNYKIKVLKNRIGADGNSLYANMDFENGKIKIIK